MLDTQANRLLKYVEAKKRVAELKEQRLEEVRFDAKEVLEQHILIMRMGIKDIMNDDFTLKPLREWPDILSRYITGIEVKELFEKTRQKTEMVGVLTKIKYPDKLRNFELLGKHIDVGAYKDIQDNGLETDTLKAFLKEISGQSVGPSCLRDRM